MSEASERRAAPDRGVMAYVDIMDQPKGKYLLSVDISPVQSLVYYVDRIAVDEKRIEAWRQISEDEFQVVIMFAPTIPWHAILTEYVDVVTTEQMMKKASADHELMHKLQKDLQAASQCGKESEADPANMLRLVQKENPGQYL